MHSFQSTLPLRGATGDVAEWFAESVISIHTPLAGSDRRRVVLCPAAGISIHTPLAGSDGRRRTSGRGRSYFNPHSPCGERPSKAENRKEAKTFQSTLPLRGATRRGLHPDHAHDISIHTPLAGSDHEEYRRIG